MNYFSSAFIVLALASGVFGQDYLIRVLNTNDCLGVFSYNDGAAVEAFVSMHFDVYQTKA